MQIQKKDAQKVADIVRFGSETVGELQGKLLYDFSGWRMD
jgi:hypothetical protein